MTSKNKEALLTWVGWVNSVTDVCIALWRPLCVIIQCKTPTVINVIHPLSGRRICPKSKIYRIMFFLFLSDRYQWSQSRSFLDISCWLYAVFHWSRCYTVRHLLLLETFALAKNGGSCPPLYRRSRLRCAHSFGRTGEL